jgi:CHAT domain-containing protein/tetratricopeptide (TPR) repeat protein
MLWVAAHGPAVAQCVSAGALRDRLQQIDSQPIQEQSLLLRQWCTDWTTCSYPRDSTYVDGMLQLGLLHINQREYSEARRLAQTVIRLYRRPTPNLRKSDLSKACYRQGVALHYLGLEDEKMGVFKKTLLTADASPAGKLWASNAHLYLVYGYYAKGDYQQALYHADRGEALAREVQNHITISKILQQKAQVLSEQKRYDAAKDALEAAIGLLKNDPENQRSVASQYRLLGILYQNLNQTDQAVACLNTAFRIAQEQAYKPSDFAASLGYLYYELGKYPQALRYYRVALALDQSPYSKSILFDNIGAVYWKQKQFRRAFSYYQYGIAELVTSFKPTHIQQIPSAQAIRQITQKSYLLTTIQDKADTWLDYARRAPDSASKKVRLQNALRTYALADSMIDYMRYEHEGEGSRLFWRQQTHGLYERALEACYLAHDPERAFHFLEKSKAVLLADKLNELGATRQLSQADARQQRTLRDSVVSLRDQLTETPTRAPDYSALQSRLESVEEEFDLLRKKLEKINPAYYRYKYDTHTPTLAEFRQELYARNEQTPYSTTFVSFFTGDSAIYALVLTLHQVRLIKIGLKPTDYEAYANELLSLCSDRATLNAHYPRYQALAHFLYQQLWQPLTITTPRVIVAPDGLFLPLEALLATPAPDDFLLRHHAISYAYSARLMQPSADVARALPGSGFVGFAPEFFKSHNLPPLSGSPGALASVGDSFWFGKNLINAEATKANFLRYAPSARVIQLFTHADADSTNLTEPRLYFHDAALNLSELNRVERFNAQLVVLSACRTGVGANQRGEGVFSLARSFAALGVPSTITTLWTVENKPTYALTRLFYTHLNEGLPKDIALQRAKLDWLREGGTVHALPSQWAGMILVGEAGALHNGRWFWWVGGLMLALIVGGTIGWRYRRILRLSAQVPAAGRP